MENNQSTQQQSSELSNSKLAETSSRQEIAQPGGLNSLLELLKHRPWLLWSGVWAFLLAIIAIATLSLIDTSIVEHEEPQPSPIATENPAQTSSQTGSPMSLWLLGAVALSCAAGYLVISKRLNSSSWPLVTRHQQEPPPVPTPLEPLPPVELVPAETEPVVTVVPTKESHPLDSGSQSLAEMMDIRKQRPLSSILRGL